MVTTLKKAKKLFPFKTLKYIYTENKKPEAVQMTIEDFINLMETLDIMKDKKLIRSIERGLKEIREGKLYSHSEIFH